MLMRVRIVRSAQKRRHAVNETGAGRSPSAARTCRHDRAVRQSTRRLPPPAQATAACTHAHTHCHALRHWPMDSDRAPALWIEQCAEQAPEHIPSLTSSALSIGGGTRRIRPIALSAACVGVLGCECTDEHGLHSARGRSRMQPRRGGDAPTCTAPRALSRRLRAARAH